MGRGARVNAAACSRRDWLLAAAAGVAGCSPAPEPAASAPWEGGWVGDAAAVGHRWRDALWPESAEPLRTERVSVLVVGAGVCGLAAARALRRRGIDDIAVLDLHDHAGGNSRAHAIGSHPCPMGAHYLPVPGRAAVELSDWLHEIGLARSVHGRTRYDERHLCHSPQERLFFEGAWHDSLLPPLETGSAGHAQARHLSARIETLSREAGFSMPSTRTRWRAVHAQLDAISFAHWLQQEGVTAPPLRWYLDYCCRDDYGAPSERVSAWAGIHYFASRHGFRPPGAAGGREGGDDEAVLTWPEGNAWLVHRLLQGTDGRVHTGWLVDRVQEQRHGVVVQARSSSDGRRRRWQAQQVVLAVPLRWAARMLSSPPAVLLRAAAVQQQAPWLVANLLLDGPPVDRPGTLPAWDNVVYGQSSLGYVDALHQTLGDRGRGALITAYHALPAADRPALLERDWAAWSRWVVDDLARVHPDLPPRVRRVDLARHGHAMSIPAPGIRGSEDLAALRSDPIGSRLRLAHADLVGYSVFEEAFTLGHVAGEAAAAALRASPPRRS